MKKITLLLFAMLTSTFMFSQVGISSDFDSGTPTGWSVTYSSTSESACSGNSVRDNIWSYGASGNLTTPNQVGLSNGTDLEISFDYKILDYSSSNPSEATAAGWGTAELQYSNDDGSSWNTVLTIDDSNHVVATTCATMMTTIPGASLPTGSDVKLRILNTWVSGDYYFYVDNFVAAQTVVNPPNCDSALTQTTNVSLDGDISWSTATGIPTGYYITVGTSSGGNDLVDNVDNGNVLSYSLGTLNEATTYYVTITPYNDNGSATGCTESSFTTLTTPLNDECSDAEALTVNLDLECGTLTSGTILGATDSGITDSSCNGTSNDDVWYSFVATSTLHKIDLSNVSGSPTDLYHAVYDGTSGCGTLGAALTCSDSNSSETSGLTIGNTYYVQVYSYSSAEGSTTTFDVCVGTPPAPPVNDTCSGAIAVTESTDSSCDNAISGTTVSASNTSDYECSTYYNDVWYTFTPSETNSYIFNRSLTTGTSSTYLSVYSGDCGSLTRINSSCYSTSLSEDLTAGETYYVSVASSGEVDFDLCVYKTPLPPANDDCSGAIAVTESTTFSCDNAISGTTVSASNTSDNDCYTTYNDVWYTFTPSETNSYFFNRSLTTGTSTTYLSVYSGDCGSLTRINSSCYSTALSEDLIAGETYYVSVASYGEIDFDLCIYPEDTTPPANDECVDAISLPVETNITDLDSATQTDGEIGAATDSGVADNAGTANDDVWYSFTATVTDINIDVIDDFDGVVEVFSGDCTTLTSIEHDDFDGANSNPSISRSDYTVGETYYVRVYNYASVTTNSPAFKIAVWSTDSVLSIGDFESQSLFNYYPNPVNNQLSLRAQANIQNVAVYNMLGQEVITAQPNTMDSDVDMSALQTGAYFVKVTINGNTETIRVIKN